MAAPVCGVEIWPDWRATSQAGMGDGTAERLITSEAKFAPAAILSIPPLVRFPVREHLPTLHARWRVDKIRGVTEELPAEITGFGEDVRHRRFAKRSQVDGRKNTLVSYPHPIGFPLIVDVQR